MPTLEPFANMTGTLDFKMQGKMPAGLRLDAHFAGTITSEHWEGEWPVSGIDYVTVRGDGIAELFIRASMGEGDDIVSYEATGRQTPDGIIETLYFQTASETFAHLNGAVGVASGSVDGDQLSLEIFLVKH